MHAPLYALLGRDALLARAARASALWLTVVGTGGCSLSGLAAGGLSSALADSGTVFARDDDPELVRDALPLALKTMEVLLEDRPDDEALLLATCRGFTQYAYAFIEAEIQDLSGRDYAASEAARERAVRMYLRALGYGLRGLATRHAGIAEQLAQQPEAAASRLGPKDVPLAYWSGLAWGAAISLAIDRPALVADVDAVRALLDRCLELDEDHDSGGLQTALIRIEALPELMGGSPERAREHFARAIELSGGNSVGPYVALASSLAITNQDRAEFESLLTAALAIDLDAAPELRLANRIDQRRARTLLRQVDNLILEPLE